MLQEVDRFASGNSAADLGLVDLSVIAGPQGLRLFTYSGTNGGVASYAIDSSGRLSPLATAAVSVGHGLRAETDMTVATLSSTTALLIGVTGSSGLAGWGSNLSGAIGRPYALALPSGFSGQMHLAPQPDPTAPLFVLSPQSGRVAAYDPDRATMVALSGPDAALQGSHGLSQAVTGGQTHLISIDSNRAGLTVLRHDAASQSLSQTDSLTSREGLAVAALSDLAIAQGGGQTFVIAAAAGSSSLTVLRLSSEGQLTLADHILDSRDTRFQAVAALDSLTIGAQTFVAAGGGDDGITLFRLLPDGTLQTLATLEDSLTSGLTNVSALKLVHIGSSLFLYVGGETEQGLSVLQWRLDPDGTVITTATPGATVTGTPGADVLTSMASGQSLLGGDGADVLIATASGATLTGGAGADSFVLRDAALDTTISDFQRGLDQLDLGGWPLLRDISQLVATPTAEGLSLAFNGRSVTLRADDGRPLTLADVLPQGLGPSRLPPATLTANPEGGSLPGEGDGALSPGTPTPPGGPTDGGGTGGSGTGGSAGGGTGGTPPGGSTGGGSTGGGPTPPPAVTLPAQPFEPARLADWSTDPAWADGSTAARSLSGTPGDDTLIGASGSDFLQGGLGDDLLYTGLGNDTVFAGPGNDTLFAAGGTNELWGGPGNDVIRGRGGSDYIGAGTGDDLVDGGGGQDTIWGGAGADTLMGGSRADRLGGGSGADRLYGFGADDLIFGGPDADTVHGGLGDDTIWGGPGHDLIAGGAGNDTLSAGAGTDHLWGNAGADTFLFYRNYERSYLRDFNPAEGDEIALTQWLFNGAPPGADQIVQSYGQITAEGAVLTLTAANVIIHIPGFYDLNLLADHIAVI